MFLYTLFLIFHLSFGLLIFFLTIAFVTGAPFVPSTKKVSEKMIALANIKKGDIVYDLGSGDGRLLFLAVKEGAGKAIGFEINPYLVLYTWIKILLSPDKNHLGVMLKNFWRADLRNADVVFVYLLPWRMEALAKKLIKELKPGARIVSNSFIFPNWKILRKDDPTHVYVFST